MSESYYLVGLDLGQAADWTAISVLERSVVKVGKKDVSRYALRHLERPKLGTPYPVIVDRVATLMKSRPLKGSCSLVADSTGVGRPVIDLLNAAGVGPVAVTITGGTSVTGDGWAGYSVPKRDLVSALRVLFDSGRLQIAGELELAQVLVRELLSFKVKINVRTAHDSYEAWREGDHDDLVLSVALAAWFGELSAGPLFTW